MSCCFWEALTHDAVTSSVGTVTRLFLGLSLRGPVVKIKPGDVPVFKRAAGKGKSRKKKRILHPAEAFIMRKGKLGKDLVGQGNISSDYIVLTHSPNSTRLLETHHTVWFIQQDHQCTNRCYTVYKQPLCPRLEWDRSP